ncbi:hypothetical protein ACJMK2_025756 [Sinanodonta woodiana]|uniref:Peptidase M12B domain-containing protein n=1 Tax=Sinanodonta woodiana TaxID=1069815 RepID=A0ABD3XHZ5_SINWO
MAFHSGYLLLVILLCNIFLWTNARYEAGEEILAARFTESRGTLIGPIIDYKIEVLVVVDYSFFKHWLDKTNGTDAVIKQRETESAIEQYVGSLLYTVNLAYTNLGRYGLHMRIEPVAVLITTTPTESPWTEQVKVVSPSGAIVEPIRVLQLFKVFSSIATTVIPHDHAVLLTKYEIQIHSGESRVGYANIGTMCSDRSISVIQDSMHIYTAFTIAHELGHSLGSEHDGDGNICSPQHGFMMAPGPSDDRHNKWLFSSCTANYIHHYMNRLSWKDSNCLRKDDYLLTLPRVRIYSKQVYGLIYGADDQCQMKYGPESYVCRSAYNHTYERVCSSLFCFNPKNKLCHELEAGEGTPCGNQKWCILGKCDHDENAAIVSDSCPLGDQPGGVYRGITCPSLISGSPQRCYNNYISKICCNSCSRYKGTLNGLNKTVDELCKDEYGQDSYFCRGALVYEGGPYENTICTELMCAVPNWDRLCLKTIPADGTPCGYMKLCKQQRCVHSDFATPVPDTCPYGDQPGKVEDDLNCTSLIKAKPYRCFESWTNRTCCATCRMASPLLGNRNAANSECCYRTFSQTLVIHIQSDVLSIKYGDMSDKLKYSIYMYIYIYIYDISPYFIDKTSDSCVAHFKFLPCSKYTLVSNNCTEHGAESVLVKLPGPATVVNI